MVLASCFGALVGCGGGDDDGSSGARPDAAQLVDAGAPDALDLPECERLCGVAADCVQPGATPDRDADNWACERGTCRWLGCHASAECSPGDTCGNYATVPTCWNACTTSADCAIGTTIFSADNWSCGAGACTWLGCVADDECQADYGAGYHCENPFGFPGCYQTCTTSAGCDANAVCVQGVCLYQCTDAATCQATQPSGPGTYDCR